MAALKTALAAADFWDAQMALHYGPPASYPAAVTTIVGLLGAGATLAPLRTAVSRLKDSELAQVRQMPGLREIIALRLSAADAATALRYIEQGLLGESLGNAGAVPETMLVGPTTAPFVSTAFCSSPSASSSLRSARRPPPTDRSSRRPTRTSPSAPGTTSSNSRTRSARSRSASPAISSPAARITPSSSIRAPRCGPPITS
jgi:hypothetical protein